MRIIENTSSFQIKGPSAVTIGKFDGNHIGHSKIIQKVIEAKKEGLIAVVFTFDPSPVTFFTGIDSKELSTREEKRLQFELMGVDILIEYPLNHITAKIDPLSFIENILVKQIKVKKIIAGKDVSFGYKGKGNSQLLLQNQKKYQYQVEIVEKVTLDNRNISSTYVREEVEKGNMELVAKLLGKPYAISGIVVEGNKIGRKIGMPTVNIIPTKHKLLPPKGVYFSRVFYDAKWYDGITNIGHKPTVSNQKVIGIESFIYNFSNNIYGREITVELLFFRRPEMKFQNMEELKKQMEEDVKKGSNFFAKEAN